MKDIEPNYDRIKNGLIEALNKLPPDDDGVFSGAWHKNENSDNGNYIVTFRFNDGTEGSTWPVYVSAQMQGVWMRAMAGKARLVVNGEWRGAQTKQWPQRKDGSHNYPAAVGLAAQRAKSAAMYLQGQRAAAAAQSITKAEVAELIEANALTSYPGARMVTPEASGITFQLQHLTKAEADIMIKAARAAGIVFK